MAAPMTSQECHLAPLELAGNEGVRWIAKGRLHLNFFGICQAGHRIEPATTDDANLRLLQTVLRTRNEKSQYTCGGPAGDLPSGRRRRALLPNREVFRFEHQ